MCAGDSPHTELQRGLRTKNVGRGKNVWTFRLFKYLQYYYLRILTRKLKRTRADNVERCERVIIITAITSTPRNREGKKYKNCLHVEAIRNLNPDVQRPEQWPGARQFFLHRCKYTRIQGGILYRIFLEQTALRVTRVLIVQTIT